MLSPCHLHRLLYRLTSPRKVKAALTLIVILASIGVPERMYANINDPTEVPGLVLWLDANDINTLFTNAACSTAAGSGDTIGCWQDKSGSGSHVTEISGDCDEATGGSQTCNLPTYTIDQFNTRDALVFDRTNRDALRHALSPTWSGPFSIFIAFEQVGTPSTFYSFFSNGNPAGSDHFQIDSFDDSGTQTFRANGAGGSLVFEEFDNTLKLYAVVGTSTGTTAYADGALTQSNTGTTGRIFEHYRINQNRQGNHLNNAKIAEIIIYQHGINTCDFENVHIFISEKYGRDFFGITSNYGFGSPYDNDVVGIGAPDSSCNPANTITTATSDILTISNPTSLQTNDFLTFGNDDGGYTEINETPVGFSKRITQEWRMDEDDGGGGDGVGFSAVSFNLNGLGIDLSDPNDFALLIDDDGDFDNGGTTIYINGRSISGTLVSFTNIDFDNGDYVSLATERPIPVPEFPWWGAIAIITVLLYLFRRELA